MSQLAKIENNVRLQLLQLGYKLGEKAVNQIIDKVVNSGATPATLSKVVRNIISKIPRKSVGNGIRPVGTVSVGGQAFTTSYLGTGKGNMSTTSAGTSMVVEKTEPIMTVISASTVNTFVTQAEWFYPMNINFNWLRNLANAFTSYEILQLEFTYVPAVPTTTAGAISLVFQGDLLDLNPANMGQMLCSEQSLYAPVYAGGEGGRYLQSFGSPSGNVIAFQLPKHLYADASGVPKRFKIATNTTFAASYATDVGKQALLNYTPGTLIVASEGITTASQTLGQVFVRYKLRLSGSIQISQQR